MMHTTNHIRRQHWKNVWENMKSIEYSLKKTHRQPLELQANFEKKTETRKRNQRLEDLQENNEKRLKLSKNKFESGKFNNKQRKHACY